MTRIKTVSIVHVVYSLEFIFPYRYKFVMDLSVDLLIL